MYTTTRLLAQQPCRPSFTLSDGPIDLPNLKRLYQAVGITGAFGG
jgi:hypothetical protein